MLHWAAQKNEAGALRAWVLILMCVCVGGWGARSFSLKLALHYTLKATTPQF